MTREEKSKVIEKLTAELAENTNIYMTDVSGLNASETSKLRRACFKANIKLSVVKNTLLSKAMESSCLLYTSPSPRDRQKSRMPSSA